MFGTIRKIIISCNRMSERQAKGPGSASLVFIGLCPHQCAVIVLRQTVGQSATTGQCALLVTSHKEERGGETTQAWNKNSLSVHQSQLRPTTHRGQWNAL